MCLGACWKRASDVRCQFMTSNLASCLANGTLMIFYHATSSGEAPSLDKEAVPCGSGEDI